MGHSLFAELKRRNVFKAGAAYLALGWVVTQVTSTVAPQLHLPDWIGSVVIWIGVIGFPFVIMFSWVYELTPEGLKRESEVDRSDSITHVTGRRLDHIIIGLLVLAIGLFAFDRFVPRRIGSATTGEGATAASTGSSAPPTAPGAASAAAAMSNNSIAVLPFVNMSSDKEQEYFSDGIAEELLNLLAKIPQLHVAARTSSFSFKDKEVPIPEIAKTLFVANVLEGSVRKSGEHLRITAQLVRAADGYHLWSETYDRNLDDIFKVQDEIAAAVVEQLRVKLLGAAPTAKPVNSKAYPLILQAQALNDQGSKASYAQAAELLKQSLAIAPNEARAWAMLAGVHINQVIIGEITATDGERLIKDAASKALEIDPDNVRALSALGRVAMDFDLDLATAARYFSLALEREPGNLSIISNAAQPLTNMGRFGEAVALGEYRVARDPANPVAYFNLGAARFAARQWDASIDDFRTALRLSPEFTGAHALIAGIRVLGKADAAGGLKEVEAEPDEMLRMQTLAMVLNALGRKDESRTTLDTFIENYGRDQPEAVAGLYALRGEVDTAFAWLDKAVTMRDPALSGALVDLMLDSLHSDPRWLPFLRRIGYAPEQLAKIEFKVTLPAEWQAEATAEAAAKPSATTH